MTTLLSILTCLAWAAAAGGIAWYALNVARQITYVTLADGRRQERSLPLSFRLLLPLVPNLDRIIMHPSLARTRELADQQLISAGFEGLLSGREFLGLKILIPCLFGAFWLLTLKGLSLAVPALIPYQLPMGVLGLAMGAFWPVLWLRKTMAARHRSIQRSLPFVLDLLTLSVEAGLDFMSALQRNVERRALDAMNEELIRVVHEIQLGTVRRVALKNLADRVRLPDLRSVCNALIQADELGVSVGQILRIQSDQIRLRRFERAEKMANEAPVKLLGPLMMFIFPAVFIVLLGPVAAQLLHLLK